MSAVNKTKEELINDFQELRKEYDAIKTLYENDITNYKQVEENLTISETNYRRLFETAKDGIILLDAKNGMITDVNPFLIELLGYSKAQFVDKTIWEIGFFKDIVANQEKFLELQRKGYVRYENLPLEAADGRKIHVEFVSNVYPVNHHHVIQCNIRDITNRWRVEEALRESEEKYRVLFYGSSQGILASDIETHRILFSNPSISQLLGYTDAEFLKLSIADLHPKDSLDFVMSEFESYLRGEKPISFGLPCLRKDGMVIYADITGAFTTINGRKCAVGFFTDVTERRELEETIKKSESEFRMLAESMPQIVWITDPNGLNTYFNQQWVDYTGQSIEESYGDGWNKPFHPNDRQRAWDAWQNATKNNATYSLECRLQRADGEYKWWLVRGVPVMDKKGIILKWFGTCTDIDELKNSEETLKIAKDRAEESDRLKSAFLANMSHEIRTPMNGILGFAQLLKEPDLTGEEQQKFLGIIEKSGARMLNIINDIVCISKIESGQIEISISETDVNEQIDFVYNFFKKKVEQKGMQLIANSALSSKEAIIQSDREKLYAILTNLVGNATKFTHTGSIEFGYEKKGKYLEFFVKDMGDGIADEKKEIIFERFRQGSESLTRNYEGAGLGLSISKAYVEMLGGKIWVESEVGKGSTFYFTIPYNAKTEPEIFTKESVSTEDKDGAPKNLKLLIVEDDESSELFLSTALELYSDGMLRAKTGIEAVEVCRNNPYLDLVLMDINIPEMNGYEATRQIRQFNKDVVIIAQTAFGLSGDRQKAIDAGCTDYIAKPINITLLKAMIRKYFQVLINPPG